jgi:hypothetical protein
MVFMSVRVLVLVLLCSVLLVSVPQHRALYQEDTPPFLIEGSYSQYRQQFSSGETYELYWEITSLNESSLIILIRSHGLVYNATRESFDTVPGGGTMVIDRSTLEIVRAYYPNGTENEGYPFGERVAFWIPMATNETSLINSMYETNAEPTLVGPFEFECLSSARMCWMTKNNYSTGNWMNRYYDVQTGIVLMIVSHLQAGTAEVSVLETLNDTNIAPLITRTLDLGTLLAVSAAVVLCISAVIILCRKRNQ